MLKVSLGYKLKEMTNNIRLENRKLTVSEYQLMRASTGWSSLQDSVVEKALSNDLFSVCLFDGEKLIGMGRVIGDGAIYFYIQDIIVLPEYQGQGIGKIIMNSIEAFIAQHANHNSFIGLMSAKGIKAFYNQFGYQARPENGPGMFKVIEKA